MRRLSGVLTVSALSLGLGLAMPLDLAQAAMSGSSSSKTSNSAASTSSSVDTQYAKAKTLVEKRDYKGAVPLLDQIVAKDSRNADALNLLGYSYRKLGDYQKALTYYNRALAIEPSHLGANEYLGELYLEMKDVAKAQQRLEVLAKACNKCEEYEDLEQAIKAFKAKSS
jgi:tetratricopeptide (TPR) repeat protein